MKKIFALLVLTTSLFAQDFIPYFDELQPEFAASMRANKIKTLTIEAFIANKDYEAVSSGQNWKTIYEFNKDGKLVNATYSNADWQLTKKTEFAYNNAGEVQNIFETETTGSGDEAATSTITFFINRKAGKINFIDRFEKGNEHPDGAVTNKYLYSYDANGILTTVIDSSIADDYINPSTYYHYENGKLAKKTHPNYTVTYEYNKSGKAVKEFIEMMTATFVTTHDYDANGNLVSSMTDGETYAIELYNEYDGNKLQTKTKKTFTMKGNGSQEFELTNYTYGTF